MDIFMNWVDYVIIAVLLWGVITGIRKGFVMSVSNIACIIAAIFIAKTFYKEVAVFLINNTSIEDKITKFLVDKNLTKDLLPAFSKSSTVFAAADKINVDITNLLTYAIVNAVALLLIYLAARFALAIVESFIQGVASLPGLRELNGLGGIAIGLAKSLFILLLAFAVFVPLSSVKAFGVISQGISGSMLAKYFYSYNFILGWIWNTALELLKS